MSESIYEAIAREALSDITDCRVISCTIGAQTVAVESRHGIGLAMRYGGNTTPRGNLDALQKHIAGQTLCRLVEGYLEADPFMATVGLAAINSVLLEKGQQGTIAPNYRDRALEPDGKPLAIVGHFDPIIRFCRARGENPAIFELKNIPGTFRPEDAGRILPACSRVIMTGSAFSNRTIHHYLAHLAAGATVYILGPSTPLADCLSRFTLGSSKIVNRKGALEAIYAGQCTGAIGPDMVRIGRFAAKAN